MPGAWWHSLAYSFSPRHILHSAWPDGLHCGTTSLLNMGEPYDQLPLATLGLVGTSGPHLGHTLQIEIWGARLRPFSAQPQRTAPCLHIRCPSSWLLPRIPNKGQGKNPLAPSVPTKRYDISWPRVERLEHRALNLCFSLLSPIKHEVQREQCFSPFLLSCVPSS